MSQLPPIVYVSNAGWTSGLPTNRQQLPLRLAAHTNVLYSSPFSLSQVLMGRVKLRDYEPGLREVAPGLQAFHNLQLLPLVRGQVRPLSDVDRWLTARALAKQVRRLGHQRPILWMYYPPSNAHLIDRLDASLSVYHCTDDHAGYAEALGLDPEKSAREEAELVEAVDVVFATSRPLYEMHRRRNPRTFLMPNVADVERFAPVGRGEVAPAAELAHLPHPVAGFIGAVDAYKVDFELVDEVARRLPGWSFVFVGPVGVGDGTGESVLPKAPNVHYLGPRPHTSLPSYIAGFDVCTIPYRLNRYTAGVFPLKFWEYLAAGKPVVSTALPGLVDDADCAYLVRNAEDFAAALVEAARSAAEPRLIAYRTARAAQNSWEARAGSMVKVLLEQMDKKSEAIQTSSTPATSRYAA
jgi:glycosyltransferase involved in cell wall biosynthesis